MAANYTTIMGLLHLNNNTGVTTASPKTTSPGDNSDDTGNVVGAIIGGMIGGILCVAVIVVLVVMVMYRRRRKRSSAKGHPVNQPGPSTNNTSLTIGRDNPGLDSLPRSEANVYTLPGRGVMGPSSIVGAGISLSPTGTLNRDYELVGTGTLTRIHMDVTQFKADTLPSQKEDMGPWEIPRYLVKLVEKLGHGRFGNVWKGQVTKLKNNPERQEVAVKMLKDSATDTDKRDFLRELDVMKNMPNHPNVVALLACCTKSVPLLIVLEFMAMGDLRSFLRSGRSSHPYGNLHGGSHSLTSRDLILFAYQVASGMSHISDLQLLHRDLAARNVLVSAECICKVSDFGLARDVINSHIYHRKSQGPLPVRWMAPESIFDNVFTTQSDVWSFGVLVWEIVTLGGAPYPGMTAKEVLKFIRSGGHMTKPEHCGEQLYSLMEQCWRLDADDRPNFSSLVVQLSELLRREVTTRSLHLTQLQLSLHQEALRQTTSLDDEPPALESQLDIRESTS